MSNFSDVVLATAGVVDLWEQNELSGTTATDATGANNGTYQNSPTLGLPGPEMGGDDRAAGYSGPGATPSYLLCKSGAILAGQSTFSIEAFIRTNQALDTGGRPIYCERGASGNDILKLEIAPTPQGQGQCGLTYRDDAGHLSQPVAQTPVNDNRWHLVGVTCNIGTGAVAFYCDGRPDGTATLTASTNATMTNTLESRVASDIAGLAQAFLLGEVGAVATFTGVLPAATMLNHYEASGLRAPPGVYPRDFGEHTFGPF